MRLQVVADVHGDHEALAKRLSPAEGVLLLGDNMNLIDFRTLSGIATRVLSKADVARIILAMATGGAKKGLAIADKLFFKHPAKQKKAREEVGKDYEALAGVLPEEAVVLFGNVDYPDVLQERMGARFIDCEKREIGGRTFGFISGTGAYPFSMNLPGEMTDDAFERRLFSLGRVDVLCSHFPPDVDDLTWDTVAKRSEGGGSMINRYIQETKPALHLFGHIHNPKQAKGFLGETKLVNVGGFRYHHRIHTLSLETLTLT